jgi:DNA-binding NarL/FixJ family response regulator
VLVLYSHALLGQGLERLLAAEQGLDVHAVDVEDETAVAAALEATPDVIVFEEGGRLEALELMRRTACPLLIDVNIGTSDAWTIRRDTIRTPPERLFEVILDACVRGPEAIASVTGAISIVPDAAPAPKPTRRHDALPAVR